MATDDTDRVYYVISDLHIGGDEQLEEVEFLDELLAFLEDLETTDENAELIINGDAFGLWEFTTLDGLAKFDALLRRCRWRASMAQAIQRFGESN
jgi:UDP-2,3-diacylglucosamine pyrophosphatase LpxH